MKKVAKKEKDEWPSAETSDIVQESKSSLDLDSKPRWETEKIDVDQLETLSDIARSSTPVSVVNISDDSSIEVEVKIEEQTTPVPKQHPQFVSLSQPLCQNNTHKL